MSEAERQVPWYAQGDPWVLTQDAWEPDRNVYYETVFTQSNGYMGVRGYTEEVGLGVEAVREGYLAGVFGHTDKAALKQTKVTYDWPMLAMITLPELFACEVDLEGERFDMSTGRVVSFLRTLEMRQGELRRGVVWESPTGRRTRLEFRRFLSAANVHLGMQQVRVTLENWSGTVTLHFEQDGAIPTYFRCGDRSMPHLPQALLTKQHVRCHDDDTATLAFKTRGTEHTVVISSIVQGAPCVTKAPKPKTLQQHATMILKPGEAGTVLHTVAVVSSRDTIEGGDEASALLKIAQHAAEQGYGVSLSESEKVWRERWRVSDMKLDGPARDQAYIRYGTFGMLQMAPFHTDTMSVPARAYAYNRYHGLYYWDSESFLLPQYLYTHPQVARNLLQFRQRTLDGARRTAEALDAPGACFPWMTDSDDGTEQAPWHLGDYLWHQNADIAYAVDQYVRSTGDVAFMMDAGLEIMVESARFWMSCLEEDADGVVHLHDTVGPDELDKHGKDNGFASLMCRRHLRLAAGWAGRLREARPEQADVLLKRLKLTERETGAWLDAADGLCAPMIPGLNIPLQDEFLLAKKPLKFDGLTVDEAYAMRHTHRVVKQSDIVMVMYLLQDEFTLEQKQTAFDFYEPMTLHFSSLSYNTHSILASMIGRRAQAYDYFMKAAGLDLDDLREATKDGLHAAALGGTWQTILYGFLGMRLADDGLVFEPRLPDAWRTLKLCIRYRGYLLKLDLAHEQQRIDVVDEQASARRDTAHLTLNDQRHALRDGLSVVTTRFRSSVGQPRAAGDKTHAGA